MNRKTFSLKITGLDYSGRTVEGYANVFGNLDEVGDVVHPGAFAKTLNERGGKIRFLWQHDLTEPLGKVLEMREDDHGLFFKAVISDTQRGRDALALLKDGAVDSFSIGYDSIKGATDYTKDPATGQTIRNLREVKLYEVSLVTLAANELATVTALKEKPSEGKPYDVVHEGDEWCVYKVDEDGKPTGEPLGRHATEEEARAQMRALYANSDDGKSAKEMTPMGPRRRMGDAMTGSMHQAADWMMNEWLASGLLSGDEHKQMRQAVDDGMDMMKVGMGEMADRACDMMGMMPMMMMAGEKPGESKAGRRLRADKTELLNQLTEILSKLRSWAEYDDETDEDPAPAKAADNKPVSEKAGPESDAQHCKPPTSDDLLRLQVEIGLEELKLLEV